jgi:hypothetical protein
MPLGFCKACNVEDFLDPSLQAVISDVYGGDVAPPGAEDRKMWEVGMAVRALNIFGALRPDAEILGVGAGRESTCFHLTNVVRRVFATDLYLTPGIWELTASGEMLGDPSAYWGRPWNPQRLVVQHMDATELLYEDGTFDGVFSSSSLEHFGSVEAIRQSATEMCRILKRGGVCTLSTELRLQGDGDGFAGTHLFAVEELHELLVDDLPWELVEPIDDIISPATRSVVVEFAQAADDIAKGRPRWTTYPHLLLADAGYVWTSVHLALRRT